MELRMTIQSRPGIPTVNATSFLHAKTQLPRNLHGLVGFIGLKKKKTTVSIFQL